MPLKTNHSMGFALISANDLTLLSLALSIPPQDMESLKVRFWAHFFIRKHNVLYIKLNLGNYFFTNLDFSR